MLIILQPSVLGYSYNISTNLVVENSSSNSSSVILANTLSSGVITHLTMTITITSV